jgi:hypothetical protein
MMITDGKLTSKTVDAGFRWRLIGRWFLAARCLGLPPLAICVEPDVTGTSDLRFPERNYKRLSQTQIEGTGAYLLLEGLPIASGTSAGCSGIALRLTAQAKKWRPEILSYQDSASASCLERS